MQVCDRCLGNEARKVSIVFVKRDKQPKAKGGRDKPGPGRNMIDAGMDLCETCINEMLKSFGHWKKKWMNEADEPDAKEVN